VAAPICEKVIDDELDNCLGSSSPDVERVLVINIWSDVSSLVDCTFEFFLLERSLVVDMSVESSRRRYYKDILIGTHHSFVCDWFL
jgi:hypothetical protein